ncbi:MAG TPA: DinB family protein [Tepidisphaeraceae bacterium]|nr:DinB family protein [Tepidisphaeraceae bacterium]
MDNQSLVHEYENAAGLVGQAIKGLSREDLLAFPVPGTWSIQQIVLHLADSEQVFADRMKRVIAEENPSLLAFDDKKWSANLHYHEQSAQDAAGLLELTRKQMSHILRNLPDSAFERKGNHNVAGPQTLRQILEKANKHLHHHMEFIVDKREKLGKIMW